MDDVEVLNLLEEFREFLAEKGVSLCKGGVPLTGEEWEALKLEFVNPPFWTGILHSEESSKG